MINALKMLHIFTGGLLISDLTEIVQVSDEKVKYKPIQSYCMLVSTSH